MRLVPVGHGLGLLLVVATTEACTPARRATQRPRTVTGAVAELRAKWLGTDAVDWILRNPRQHVVGRLYMPFGTGVRNEWGLWGDNAELRSSCGTDDPEECSAVIFEQLWSGVRADADSALVRALDCQFLVRQQAMIRYRGFSALRMGEMLRAMQAQIDSQAPALASRLPSGCDARLPLRPTGNPDLNCWVRAEFSEDGDDTVSLDLLLGWITWRNNFDTRHTPPYLELRFRERCAWPERPTQFSPPG